MVRVSAPAKVNLLLRVLAREASGFHQLETLFQAVALDDSILIHRRGEDISLVLDGPQMGPPEKNLVYRAARAFRDAAGIREGVEIHLEKRIPIQAGLGGGSSDAAAVLQAMAVLFPDRVDFASLLSLAGELGSDVPFFLSPSPLSMAWGRGHRLFPLPALPRKPVLLAVPPFGVNTAEAYALLARSREANDSSQPPAIFRGEDLSEWDELRRFARNDFEEVIFSAQPPLALLKEAMERTGPILTLLSGSGSCLFSVFQKEEDARASREGLQADFPGTRFLVTHTLEKFPDPISGPGVEG